jgi:ABC-type glycerol-3-phosphate transport system substrate-binding protein
MKLYSPLRFFARVPVRIAAALFAVSVSANLALAETHVVFWQFSTRDADVAAWKNAIAEFEKRTARLTHFSWIN